VITAVPLPHWRDLLAGPPPLDDDQLAAPWSRAGDRALWFGRGAWALRAVAEAFAARTGRRLRLAVPEFFCNQSLWPLRHGPADLLFHPVDEDGHARLDNVPECDALLLVHLFGRPARAADGRAFCDRAGALLIEDGAHALGPAPGIGEAGDLVLYSPHKLLAVPDGSVLLVRPRAGQWFEPLGEARGNLGGLPPQSRAWLIKRMIQASPAGRLLPARGQADFLADPPEHAMAPEPFASPLSRRLLARANLGHAATRRRANQAALAQAIGGLPGWTPFAVPEQAAPYRAAFRCESEMIAVKRFDALRRAGLPAESWPDLPAQAQGAARTLRRTVLCLACHQTLDASELAQAYATALEGTP
jgi:hypothetical protein